MKKSFIIGTKTFLSVIIFALCLASCEESVTEVRYVETEEWTDFEGKWTSLYDDGYTVGKTTISYDDAAEEYSGEFTANIIHFYIFVVSSKTDSGVFIIKLTSGENEGKYIAVYFRDFRESPKTADLTTAYSGYDLVLFDTEEEAVEGFVSISAMSQYTKFWSSCIHSETAE
ncbi:MAG: hypothetical protein LBE74_04150 [Treponema sp.]|jgi:hypothetical protein|nr:hypothetical protein [Treponema sp.]